jgi:hypothetical protein
MFGALLALPAISSERSTLGMNDVSMAQPRERSPRDTQRVGLICLKSGIDFQGAKVEPARAFRMVLCI